MESVQRHSSVRHGNNDDGQMDFSLTAIDLQALRFHLSGVITSNKDRWKELSVHGTTHAYLESKFPFRSSVNTVSQYQDTNQNAFTLSDASYLPI